MQDIVAGVTLLVKTTLKRSVLILTVTLVYRIALIPVAFGSIFIKDLSRSRWAMPGMRRQRPALSQSSSTP
jgi:hypothetical protein